MTTTKTLFVCFVLALILNFVPETRASALVPIPVADFDQNTIHETFNEDIDYSNAVNSTGENNESSLVFIGTSAIYAFSQSGVILISPIPNAHGPHQPGIALLNCKQDFLFGTYGQLLPDSGLIPGGTGAKFLLETGSSLTHFAPLVLTFPGDGATRVGGYFIMGGTYPGYPDEIIVTAYDSTGDLLGTASIPACNVEEWANNFLGFETDDGSLIKSIGINYSNTPYAGNPGVANLMFEPGLIGDVNRDCSVDVVDLLYMVDSWGKFSGEDGYDPRCDFNHDGSVDVVDLLTLAENWGRTIP